MLLNYSVELNIVSLVIFIIMLLISKPWVTYINPQKQNTNKGLKVFFCIFLLFNIFQFWARDYYSYYLSFISFLKYDNERISNYEEIYNWLAKVVNANYTLWRTIIWGAATIFTYYTAKLLDIRNRNLLVLMTLITAMNNLGNVTRGVFGHTMIVLGVVLFQNPKSNFISKIIGVCLFCFSYFFHKSMYINMILAVVALVPFRKGIIKMSLIAFPFLTIVATYLINSIATGELVISLGDGVGGVGDRSVSYATLSKQTRNIFGNIKKVLELAPGYIALIYSVKEVMFSRKMRGLYNEKIYLYLTRFSFVTIYIASLFAFVDISDWLFLRVRAMGLFPLIFVVAKIFSIETKSNLYIKSILIISLLYSGFVYCITFINGGIQGM